MLTQLLISTISRCQNNPQRVKKSTFSVYKNTYTSPRKVLVPPKRNVSHPYTFSSSSQNKTPQKFLHSQSFHHAQALSLRGSPFQTRDNVSRASWRVLHEDDHDHDTTLRDLINATLTRSARSRYDTADPDVLQRAGMLLGRPLLGDRQRTLRLPVLLPGGHTGRAGLRQ